MSLEQHSIDQGYRARLGNLEVAPPAHAWAAISAQLPNKKADEKGFWLWGTGAASTTLSPEEKSKRERVVFWWWTGGLVALAAISILAYYGLNATATNNNPTPTPKPSAAALIPIASASDLETRKFNSSISTTEDDCPEILASTELDPKTSGTSQSRISKSRSIESLSTSHSPSSAFSYNHKVTSKPNVSIPSTYQAEGPLPTDTKQVTPPTTTDPIGISMASTSMKEVPFNGLTSLETEATKPPFGPGVGCPDFNNHADWSFAVRLFAGPGTVFQEYTSTAQTAAYKILRDSIENKQLSIHGGLRFEAVSGAGLFLRAGADYQMYRSNIEYLGPRMSRTIIDSVFMEDTQTWRVETRNESFQEQRTVYNRHHAVVLTAGVGFRKTFGNVSPYIMAEAGYELLFKKKGNFVLPDGNFVDLAGDDNNLYINDRPGFQYGGVLGVDFALTDRIEVGVSGHYKQLGGLRGSADLLDFDQSTAFGALNVRYTIR